MLLTIFMMYNYYSQEKSIEYINCFHDVDEMVYIIITIGNIPLIFIGCRLCQNIFTFNAHYFVK